MKKKITITLLCLVCALCCAFGLAACDNDGGNGGGVYLVRSDGTDLGSNPNLGEFTYLGDDSADVFDFKVCTKDDQGEFVDLKAEDVTVTYKLGGEVMNPQPTDTSDFVPGYYEMEVKYNGSTIVANFRVNTSDKIHYVLTPSKLSWKYGEEGADLTVNDVTDFTGYFISEADYDEIKDAADKDAQLLDKRLLYSSELLELLTPGAYYLFAYCEETDTAPGAYTDFRKITVQKGDLTVKDAESITTYDFDYYYCGIIGNIKLSDISIDSNSAYAVDGFGRTVNGEFVWSNENTEVNSTKTGHNYPVKFVAEPQSGVQYYNEKMDVAQPEITVNKGYIDKPHNVLDYDSEHPHLYGGSHTYDGKPHSVSTGSRSYAEYVDVTLGDQKMDVTNNDRYGSIIGSVTNVGTYSFTLALKDKVNYYWSDYYSESDPTDTANLTFTYNVLPMESYVRLSNIQLVPDNNGVIMLEIAPYASPYQAETLTAEYVKEADQTYLYDANIEIVTEAGIDYLKISDIVINNVTSGYTQSMPVRFTATGISNYADIDETDYINLSFHIHQPTVENLFIYKTTTAQILYDTITDLTTTVGDYTLKMEYSPGYWMTIDKAQSLPQLNVTYNFKLVFEVDSSKMDDRVTVQNGEINFTITGVDFDCPLAADTAPIEAAAGTTVYDALQGHLQGNELTNDYGSWRVQWQNENDEWNYADWAEVEAGTTEYRLFFDGNENFAGSPDPVTFTIIGTEADAD